MAYTSWSVIYGEQPAASKWNILGTNDAHFYTYMGEGTNAIQQVQNASYSAVATTTTALPLDDTIPQNTEGGEFMSLAITPKSATNKLKIDVIGYFANSTTATIAMALFQDTTANALACTAQVCPTASYRQNIALTYYMTSGTTSSTTFKVRAGTNGGGTLTFNGSAGAREYGAITKSSITITELKV